MRKLSAKWVLKCLNTDQKRLRCQSSWATFGIFGGAIKMISYRARLVTMDETWLYYYEPETNQQSMEWRHSGSPSPKKFRVQKSARKVLASIFWDQDGILLIDYLPKGQTINAEYSSSLLVWCNWRTFWRKNAAGRSPRVSCSCTIPRLTGCLQLRRNWPTWTSNVSITHPISRYGPVGLPPVPWTKKTIERSPFFVWRGNHCCRGDLVGRTTFWFSFEWLSNVRATD